MDMKMETEVGLGANIDHLHGYDTGFPGSGDSSASAPAPAMSILPVIAIMDIFLVAEAGRTNIFKFPVYTSMIIFPLLG